ncbi:MAG: HupE/UreJ family protein [Parvularculaceae bacterium]
MADASVDRRDKPGDDRLADPCPTLLRAFATLFLLLTLLLSFPALAHESRPLTVVINQQTATHFLLTWRAPSSIDPRNAPALALGAPCTEQSRAMEGFTGRALYECAGGIEGARLSIDYPAYNPSVSSLVRVLWKSGEVSTQLLPPETTRWRAPAPETFSGVARSYFELGVKHIVIGVDHILFLIGLLILARTPRRVLVTVTGFTIAHSITLALVALNLVRVSVPAIEAAIALSIVFVAAEIARGNKNTLAWRRPIRVASTFGLLHGAGFAAVLGEIGLPQTEKLTALFFFNVGVEAGQVSLVLVAFAWLWFVTRARTVANKGAATPMPELATRLAGYGLGVVSAYWFLERAGALFA